VAKRWTCPYCRTRLTQTLHEERDHYQARCTEHRQSRHCPARTLASILRSRGLVVATDGERFIIGHDVLKEAGLVERHRTKLLPEDHVKFEPWVPQWAVSYERHLAKRRVPYAARRQELQYGAADPDRVKAFMALAATDEDARGGR
jgi:hypothetical protein